MQRSAHINLTTYLLKNHKLSKFIQDETENWSSIMSTKKIKFIVINIPDKNSLSLDCFTQVLAKHWKNNTNATQSLQKIRR